MTTTTPPGWYAEPGHTGNGPAMERWWDGSAWTEYTRTAPVPSGAPAVPGAAPGTGPQPYGAQPPYAPYPSGDVIGTGGGRGPHRNRNVTIAIVAALVVIGGVVAGIVAVNDSNDDDSADKASTPTPTATLPSRQPSNPQSQNPDDPSNPDSPSGPSGGPAVDVLDGISLPVPDGWDGGTTDGGYASLSTGTYPCPNATSSEDVCSLGGVTSQPAQTLKLTATGAEGAAKQDITANATASYNATTYGKTTSHQVLQSKAVTVAGQKGYLVRWKVETKSGTDGYVESLAFPAPAHSSQLVMVRFGFDVGGKAPGQDVMDQIAQGIKADSSGGSSAGSSSGGTGV